MSTAPNLTTPARRRSRRGSCLAFVLLVTLAALACAFFPYRAYLTCGSSQPAALPETVRVGLYEEFPTPERLARLSLLDFPVSLAVAAQSRAEFLQLRDQIYKTYPAVRAVAFWPTLALAEGYYPGPLSDPQALQRAAAEAEGLVTLWDLELPPRSARPQVLSWLDNRAFLANWLSQRTTPVYVWRRFAVLGLDPLALRAAGLHFDPSEYPQVWLHLDLYSRGQGRPAEITARVLRCGVERYGEHFVPAFGALDDGRGPAASFVPAQTLARDLRLAREAGVSEVWLFSAAGLNADYLRAVRESLPMEGR